MFAGMIIRPRATSERTSSAESFSRRATYCISSVIDAFARVMHLRANRVVFALLDIFGSRHVALLKNSSLSADTIRRGAGS